MDALDGELQSVKQVLDRRIRAIEESLYELKIPNDGGLKDVSESLKEKFLHDYSSPRSKTVYVLHPTAVPFSLSMGLVGKREVDRSNSTFAANGGDGDQVSGERTDRDSRRSVTTVGDGWMSAVQQQRPAPFDGKTPGTHI